MPILLVWKLRFTRVTSLAIVLELACAFETTSADSRAAIKLSQLKSNFSPRIVGQRISSVEVAC